MASIQDDLQQAVDFIRSSKSFNLIRDRFIEQLTKDLIYLDGTESSPQRREAIHAIQNVISQLEDLHLSEGRDLQSS